jgi:peptidoglycan-N-acetylglucosamine deacetylase
MSSQNSTIAHQCAFTRYFLIPLLVLWSSGARAEPTSPETAGLGGGLRDGMIISGATKHRLIHFTFDDGPNLQFTPLILDKLDKLGIKATFFFSGSRFRAGRSHHLESAELARQALSRGHTIGVHSVDHQRMFRMNARQIETQLEQSEAIFVKVFGQRAWLFRPPWGSHSALADALLAKHGYTVVLWNTCVADWVERPVKRMLTTFWQVLKKIEETRGSRGGVVLLHDTHPWTIEALELVYADIQTRNCQLLKTDEELYDVVDDLNFFFRPRGASASQRAPAAEPDPAIIQSRQAALRAQTAARCQSSE